MGESLNLLWDGLNIIELGSGDRSKIRLLLRQAPQSALPTIKYYAVDISQSAIKKAAKHLASEFPMIQINGVVADFIRHLNRMPKTANRLFCFFGSTIGNLDRIEIKTFMDRLGLLMQSGNHLLLGMDMVKERAILENAYNDVQQITADFNKNILNVVNHLLHTDFDPTAFEHLAFYDEKERRIEMHLKAKNDMVIGSEHSAEKIYIKQAETIHTENSHKFTRDDIESFGRWAGLDVIKIYTDVRRWFSLVHFRKT